MNRRATPSLALAALGVRKSFPLPDGGRLEVLKGASLEVREGESVAIMGVSGSGKTTFLHILAGIDEADEGSVRIEGGRPGLVFQAHYLLPELDALENVALAARLAGAPAPEASRRAAELLDEVGLAARARHLPSELSGGETARVALARALASGGRVILADEPTGNLDEETSAVIQDLLFSILDNHGRALVIVTHDPGVAARTSRRLRLEHGLLG